MTLHLALIHSSQLLLFKLDRRMVLTPQPCPITDGHFTPLHLTAFSRCAAKRQDEEYHWALSPHNELLSLLTLNRYPLELPSANHLLFSFCSILDSTTSTRFVYLALLRHKFNQASWQTKRKSQKLSTRLNIGATTLEIATRDKTHQSGHQASNEMSKLHRELRLVVDF